MNNGFSSLGGATLHGLVDINSDSVTSTIMNADTIILGGVDILTLIDTNAADILTLNQITTGISYIGIQLIDNNGIITYRTIDATTIENNVNISKDLIMTAGNPMISSANTSNLTLKTIANGTGINLSPNSILGLQVNTNSIINYLPAYFNNTASGQRQILNTFYNLQDTDITAGGTYRGRLYSDSASCYLELAGVGHRFVITIGAVDVFNINSTALSLSIPLICNGGGANTSTIDQYSNSLNIQNNSTPKTSTSAITGFIPSDFLSNIMIVGSSATPLINGTITGDNFIMANLYTSIVTTLVGMSMQSSYPTKPLNVIFVSGALNIGFSIPAPGNAYFTSGTYVTVNLGGGYFQLNQPLISAMPSQFITAVLITLNKPLLIAASVGNIYVDYNASINFQLLNGSSVLTNVMSVKQNGINCPIAPTLASHLTNKAYVDNFTPTSLKVTNSTNASNISFISNAAANSYNNITQAGDNVIYAGGNLDGVLTLTTWSGTTCGVRISPSGNSIMGNTILSSCLYGRNDGFNFNAVSVDGGITNGLYPIGYCWEILGSLSTPSSGSNYAGTLASPSLGLGVWAISGYMVLNKGTGAYIATSRLEVLWETVTGIRIYPASSGMRFPIPSTNTTAQLIIPLGTINVVVTTAGAIQTITRSLIMTVGTATWQVSFTGVKIA